MKKASNFDLEDVLELDGVISRCAGLVNYLSEI